MNDGLEDGYFARFDKILTYCDLLFGLPAFLGNYN